MKLSNIKLKKILFFIAPVSFLLLASCGSYEYSGYESDGIYGETNRVYQEHEQYATQDSNSSYYKNLFSEEAALYGEVLGEGAIFTDVEGYSSTGDYDPSNANQSNYQGGNAPWGEDPDQYTINFYNSGFYSGFYNPYWGGGIYAFDPYWGPAYYGPGFYGPGYWGPWGIGSRGFYRGHFGFGFGFAVHPFIYGGYGYYNPYNFHGYRYSNYRNNIAYNTGRRNSVSNFRNNRVENLRNATSLSDRGRSSSYSRSIRNLRNSNDDYGISRRTYSREYQTRSNTNSPYSTNRSRTINRSSQNQNSGTYSRSSNSNRSSGTVRRTTPARSSSGTVRSSSNTSRSSGTTRSSSGGSSNRGRGN
ncbi:hypothetical protein ACKGJN_00250 [Gillisia sp. Q332]|uniref:hypothetical protein n=1 Tax=Gillisia xinjiangensis TaxID=3384765 RepID=UPI003918829A